MKTIALLALWPLFSGYTSKEPSPAIMGDWLLQESSTSGCFTTTMVVYKPDEQKIMHFSPPNRYTITSRDTVVASGTFELMPKKNLEAPINGSKLTLSVQQSILSVDQSIQSKSAASPSTRTVYELTDTRLVIGTTITTFRSRSVYSRIL
jgi:hypothetical protein